MLKPKLEQEVNTMTLEDLMKIIPESEANSEYVAKEVIKDVNENRFPIIEMRDKLVSRLLNERYDEVEKNGHLFKESDFDFGSMFGDEFVIRLTKFGWANEYFHVRMKEENGKAVISDITIIGNHLPCEPKPDDDTMRLLLFFAPSVERHDYCNDSYKLATARTLCYEKYGYSIPKQELEELGTCSQYYFLRTILAMSYFVEKCRNQTKVFANTVSKGSSIHSQAREASNNTVSPKVIKIDDVTVIYPNKGNGERTFTRHTESWLVRGHFRHYKSGKVVAIKPFIKGDRSVPVQNKVYQVV